MFAAWPRQSGGGVADVDNATKDSRVERLRKIRLETLLTLLTMSRSL